MPLTRFNMRSQQKLATTPGRKSIPILLVDDDVQLCSSLKRLLGMDGFDVKAVHDGESGVRHALEGMLVSDDRARDADAP